MKLAICVVCVLISGTAYAQAWRDCIPNSIGPGGCDSMGPAAASQSVQAGDSPSVPEVACPSDREAANQLGPAAASQSPPGVVKLLTAIEREV